MYKLTDQKMQTYNGFQWEYDKWYNINQSKRGQNLCTSSWFHCYDDPLVAVFLNPAHANITNPRLFECMVKGETLIEYGDKIGVTEMQIPKDSEIDLPAITSDQKVAFAILCTQEVYKDTTWNTWADNWLNGNDRSASAASVAWIAARNALWGAARNALWSATWSAASAAWSVVSAARNTAWNVVWSAKKIDLKAIAKKTMEY